jgi:SAM-dependent methyltransferase
MNQNSILSKAVNAYKRHGIYYLVRTGTKLALDLPKNSFLFWYYRTFKSSETFEFQETTYHYFYHFYGTTWKNERAVEIPIIWDIVKRNKDQGKRILEVGNVLSYRFHVNHDILDKYEMKSGIINEDVVNFNPSTLYDLIISISTLEHVGWDETPRDAMKILYAIENLKRILAPSGELIVTLPLGYNLEMDKFLRNGRIKFSKQYYLKRIAKNRWQEVNWKDVKDLKYNTSIPAANGILVGVIKKSD